jgi:hypothetical protein
MTSPEVFVMKYLYEGNSKNDVCVFSFELIVVRRSMIFFACAWLWLASGMGCRQKKKCRSYLIFGGTSSLPVLYRHSDFASLRPHAEK